MPSVFPALGSLDTSGRRGMFIADTHDRPEHIRALTAAVPQLAGVIDVLFLEAFYANQNPGAMNPATIQTHLTDRSFDWTTSLARDLYDLSHETAAHRIEIQGIDSPLSSLWAPKMPLGMRRITWRTSPQLNSKWVFKVQQHMATKTSKRYAIFGGKEHGALLKVHGLPDLVCYEWSGAAYQEVV